MVQKHDLPKHPLERPMTCPICQAAFTSVPLRRNALPNQPGDILEQHVCPTGHVYLTEPGKNEMLAEW